MRLGRLLVLGLVTSLALAAPAQANHHFVRITEVFAGTSAQPSAEFIELRAYQSGQNAVAGKSVRIYNATGGLVQTATFASSVTVSANQMTMLLATPQAASYFGVTPDQTMTAGIPSAGGKVCWESTNVDIGIIDCVSWGNYTGPDSGHGEANPVPGAIPPGRVLLRDLSRGASATNLNAPTPANPDPGDDVDDSSADFDVVNFATPRNNAGGLTTTASAVTLDAGVMTFDSDVAGLNNRPALASLPGGDYRVMDPAAPVAASAGCSADRVDAARCPDPAAGVLNGGPGNDMLFGAGTLPLALHGEAGNDRLTGAGGDDFLGGGDGNDVLDGGTGADTLDGDVGNDTASWATRTTAVAVDLDDAAADDGNADDGAGDTTLGNIETLIGGAGDDTLTGSRMANTFDGGAGSDTIDSGGGADTVTYAKRTESVLVDLELNTGGESGGFDGGGDVLLGIRHIIGGAGDDFLSGDINPNRITGGKGVDDVHGRGGNDTIMLRDKVVPDSADCGEGTDKIQSDAGDSLTDCETPF
jgi:hypothetical protein